VDGHIRPAVIAAKLHAMATSPVLFAHNLAKLGAIIRNVASCVMSLARHGLRIVLGLAYIASDAHDYVQCLVIYYYA
jgi:hypothetical protein